MPQHLSVNPTHAQVPYLSPATHGMLAPIEGQAYVPDNGTYQGSMLAANVAFTSSVAPDQSTV
jgi:hypothetical protein